MCQICFLFSRPDVGLRVLVVVLAVVPVHTVILIIKKTYQQYIYKLKGYMRNNICMLDHNDSIL